MVILVVAIPKTIPWKEANGKSSPGVSLRCLRDYDITAGKSTQVEEPELATLGEHRAPIPERNWDDHELVFVDQAHAAELCSHAAAAENGNVRPVTCLEVLHSLHQVSNSAPSRPPCAQLISLLAAVGSLSTEIDSNTP